MTISQETIVKTMVVSAMLTALASADDTTVPRDSQSESAIDAVLAKEWSRRGITPAPLCSDDVFLRRVTLDLIGRIPTVDEYRTFQQSPDRAAKIDELLDSPEFDRFQSEVWTSLLVGYNDSFASSREVLRVWLEDQFRRRTPYDKIARQLISAEGESAFSGPVNFLLRHPETPVVKVSRAFLGVRLDCARCHDHPFDRWTQTDFELMNRFFEATERREVSEGNVQLMNVVADVDEADRPRFLTGARPRTSRWRDEFALFATSSRPFARAFANRIWYQLFGRGIVDPVDDFARDNPAVVPALLEHLADVGRDSEFDLREMHRTICNSRAWQLSSRTADAQSASNEGREAIFAMRTVRPLMPEQLVDSVNIALQRETSRADRSEFIERMTVRSLDEDFGETWEYRETVQDVMTVLAGRIPTSEISIDDMFERVLARQPTPRERTLCRDRTVSDVLFALIHSNEFRFNH